MAAPPLKFGVFYDFRNPAQFRQDWTERYRHIFDQIDWVESGSNFDGVSVSERHFVDDGYTPSVLAFATAIAAKTERVTIATNIIQLPLHNPLRIAEDSLTVDALSGGRFRLGVANGYRDLEFEGSKPPPATAPSGWRRRSRSSAAPSPAALRSPGQHWSSPS